MKGENVTDTAQMTARRQQLEQSALERQRAVGGFPLTVMRIAADMQKMLDFMEWNGETPHGRQYLDYHEKLIRDEYRRLFGCELGGITEPTDTPVKAAVRAMFNLSDEERLEVMGLFCKHCGCIQPEGRGCQCWNDE
jgi:hypothetical protein